MSDAPRHPDFEPRNTLSLVHGANSERAIAAMADEVHDTIRDVAPWLSEPQFAPAVHRYLRAAAREQLLDKFIANVCDADGPGKVPSRTWEQATAATRLAAALAADLGLTPLGHARLRAVAGSARATEIGLSDLIRRGEEALAKRDTDDPPALGAGDGEQEQP